MDDLDVPEEKAIVYMMATLAFHRAELAALRSVVIDILNNSKTQVDGMRPVDCIRQRRDVCLRDVLAEISDDFPDLATDLHAFGEMLKRKSG